MYNVVFMHGLPGSGKSTVAKTLASNNLNSIILSTDNLLTHSGNYLWNFETCSLGHKLLQSLFKEAIKRNIELIIIDNTNLVFNDIKVYVDNTPSNYEIKIVEPQTDWRYDIDKCYQLNSHNVPKETLVRMLAKKEPVGAIQFSIDEYRNK